MSNKNIRFQGTDGHAATHTFDASTLSAHTLVADDLQTVNFINGATANLADVLELNTNSNINITASTVTAHSLVLKSYSKTSSFVNLFDGGQLNIGEITQETLGSGFINFNTPTTTGTAFIDNLANLAAAQALITGQKFGITGAS